MEEINFSKITTADEQDQVAKAIEDLKVDIRRMEKLKSKSIDLEMHPTSKLLIEIQRGTNIFSKDVCALNPKPYVEIEIFPSHEVLRTELSVPEIPTWYQFFKADVKSITEIKITVRFKLNLVADSELGTIYIQFPV